MHPFQKQIERGQSRFKCCNFNHLTYTPFVFFTSNGDYRREEKSRKHWKLFIMLLSLVTETFFICSIKSKEILCIDCTKNQRKIRLSQMS